MIKRTTIMGVILILLLSSLSFNTIGEEQKGNIITVDDDGDGDYSSIQYAIDNASIDDIIHVYSGEYDCFAIHNRNFTYSIYNLTVIGIPHELGIGNSSGKPVVTGNIDFDRLIYLCDTKNCIIQGFNISSGHEGIMVVDSHNCTLIDNTISNCLHGIILKHYGWGPVNTFYTKNIIVENNSIKDCFYGVFIKADQNYIKSNTVMNCEIYGILNFEDENIIQLNYLINNGHYTIWDEPYGGGIESSGHNTIIENNIFNENVYGLILANNADNIIQYNNFLMSKDEHAYFFFSNSNTWNNNYYNDWLGIGPKIIKGYLWVTYHIPWFTLDWNPAKEPFDIPMGGNK